MAMLPEKRGTSDQGFHNSVRYLVPGILGDTLNHERERREPQSRANIVLTWNVVESACFGLSQNSLKSEYTQRNNASFCTKNEYTTIFPIILFVRGLCRRLLSVESRPCRTKALHGRVVTCWGVLWMRLGITRTSDPTIPWRSWAHVLRFNFAMPIWTLATRCKKILLEILLSVRYTESLVLVDQTPR